MANLNKVIIEGNLTADPELRQTTNGQSYCKFNIACTKKYKKKNEAPESDFIPIQAWTFVAENICKWFKKGGGITIAGRIQSNNYTDRSGVRHYELFVVADEIYFPLRTPQNNTHSEPKQPQGSNYIPDEYKSPQSEDLEELSVDDFSDGLPF